MARQRRSISDELGSLFSAELGRLSVGGRTTAAHIYEGGKKPPDVIQIVEDPYYLGGQIALEPEVLDVLWDIEDPEVREVDLELGKFGAKSTIAAIVQLVGIIECLHLVNPQAFFGLDASTIISCITVSINREQAKRVVFQRIRDLVSKSPYLQAQKPQIFSTWIEFPKNLQILCGHSGSTAQLGMGTLRAAMDETNYMVDNDNRNVAHELYDMLSGSMTTRFPNHHKLLAISSVTLGGTWLHRRVVQSQTEGEIYARRIPDMAVELRRELGGGRAAVRIACGQRESAASVSRTLAMDHGLALVELGGWQEQGECIACNAEVMGKAAPAPAARRTWRRPPPPDPRQPTRVALELMESSELSQADWEEYAGLRITRHRYRRRLSVVAPTWLMRSATRNIDDFLPGLADPLTRESHRTDFASLVGTALRPFFRVPDVVRKGARPDRASPVLNAGEDNTVASGEDIELADWFQPDPDAVYAFAADLSVSGDKTGVALVHFVGPGEDGLPRFVLDLSLRVVAERGGRIDYEPIRQLARDLRARGFRIGRVGFDQFQSNDSFVMLEKEGFACEIVKYGDSLSGCNLLHAFITAGQLVYGTCDVVFIGEAVELQVRNSKRIDHQESGARYNSKDVWDAVVNATWLAQQLSRGEYGEFLQRRDLAEYDPAEAFALRDLTAEERLLSAAERKERQLPNNGHVLMAYVDCRFGEKTDADAVAIALGAVDRRNNHCRLVAVHAHRCTPAEFALRLVDLERAWRDRGFYRFGSADQSLDILIPDDQRDLEMTLAEVAPDLGVLRSKRPFSPDIGIKAAQAAARQHRLSIPVMPSLPGFGAQLEAAITQFVSYPFTPSTYMAQAIEGLVREAEAADFTEATDLSRVVSRIA